MEKFACDVEEVLKEKLFLFKELKNIFQKEKDCIINIDIDSLWKTINQKKEIGSKIAMLSEKILSIFEETSVQIDMSFESFSLSEAIKKIPVSDATKSGLLKLKTLVEIEQDEIKAIALANSKHVNSYLLVIDDVFSTIMNVTDESQYKNSGSVPARKKGNCLIRQEV